jgi:sugar phosphate permease
MVTSFLAYIVAFALFYFSQSFALFFVAMFFFSIGEVFRTGTHKALIFNWLSRENRSSEKSHIYGITRSWSKLGSAVSIPIAIALVLYFDSYAPLFLAAAFPYLLNIINLATYPKNIDIENSHQHKIKGVFKPLIASFKLSIHHNELRQRLIESMNFEGLFKLNKSYLQPIIKSYVITLPFFLTLNDKKRTAIVLGCVYICLHLLSSFASRHAGATSKRLGGDKKAIVSLWGINGILFLLMGGAFLLNNLVLIIITFIAFAVLQNVWRPIIVSRCASCVEGNKRATVLSIESQSKSIFVAIMAPILGFIIDITTKHSTTTRSVFYPIAIIGIIISTSMFIFSLRFYKKQYQ